MMLWLIHCQGNHMLTTYIDAPGGGASGIMLARDQTQTLVSAGAGFSMEDTRLSSNLNFSKLRTPGCNATRSFRKYNEKIGKFTNQKSCNEGIACTHKHQALTAFISSTSAY
jgi:hypothetical protein